MIKVIHTFIESYAWYMHHRLIYHYFITPMTLGYQYKSCRSSLCSFLNPAVISFPLCGCMKPHRSRDPKESSCISYQCHTWFVCKLLHKNCALRTLYPRSQVVADSTPSAQIQSARTSILASWKLCSETQQFWATLHQVPKVTKERN